MPPPLDSPSNPSLRAHPHLYEINAWAWLESLSRREGRNLTLAEVPAGEWDQLARLGFNLVWLMGVWQRSPASQQIFQANSPSFPQYDRALPGWRLDQIVGSPYAVHAYVPDPRIGTWKDLDSARENLRARGMGLILDFVPNHTALDHGWVGAHPEFFVQGSAQDFRNDPAAFYSLESTAGKSRLIAHGRDPYFPPWRDTAQLNHFNPSARAALLAELRTIAKHCDGVRCDMAMLVLNDIFSKTWGRFLGGFDPPAQEFWTEAFAALPGFLWLAEVYWGLEYRLLELGFQFTYCKGLYDSLCSGRPQDIYAHLLADSAVRSSVMHFLENHDEARSAAVFGAERLPAVAALFATAPGMRLYYQGQLEGRKIHLPIELATATDEPSDPVISALYEKLLKISNQDTFHAGEWKLLAVQAADDLTAPNLIAYQWRSASAWKLVVVNLGAVASQGRVQIVDEISSASQYSLRDELNDATYTWKGEDISRGGLYVRLDAYRAQLFDITSA
jgi:hypothetical protein